MPPGTHPENLKSAQKKNKCYEDFGDRTSYKKYKNTNPVLLHFKTLSFLDNHIHTNTMTGNDVRYHNFMGLQDPMKGALYMRPHDSAS